jgi:hypothetical protein
VAAGPCPEWPQTWPGVQAARDVVNNQHEEISQEQRIYFCISISNLAHFRRPALQLLFFCSPPCRFSFGVSPLDFFGQSRRCTIYG